MQGARAARATSELAVAEPSYAPHTLRLAIAAATNGGGATHARLGAAPGMHWRGVADDEGACFNNVCNHDAMPRAALTLTHPSISRPLLDFMGLGVQDQGGTVFSIVAGSCTEPPTPQLYAALH